MKRSQIQSQLFIYILTIIVIGTIFLFGFKWISNLMETKEEIDITKFRIDLENKFRNIRDKYDTWQGFEFLVPEGIDRVCFVILEYKEKYEVKNPGLCDPDSEDYDFFMCDAWKDSTQNVLIDPMDALDEPIEVGTVSFSTDSDAYQKGYKCFDVQDSYFSLTLTGKGDSVLITDFER